MKSRAITFLLFSLLVTSCTPIPKQIPPTNPPPTLALATTPAPTQALISSPIATATPKPTLAPTPIPTSAPTLIPTPTPPPSPKPTPTQSPTLTQTPKPSPIPTTIPNVKIKTWLVPDDYKSLADAVQVALPGDIIRLKAGTHKSESIVRIDKPLTIVGDGVDVTIFEGTISLDSAKIVVKNLSVVIISVGGTTNTVENCRIGQAPYPGKESFIIGLVVRFVNNTIVGTLKVQEPIQSSSYTHERSVIASNLFSKDVYFEMGAKNYLIENNDFLGGIGQVSGGGDNNNWNRNYWAGWDATKPVPIRGNGKAVDRSPSPKPVSVQVFK